MVQLEIDHNTLGPPAHSLVGLSFRYTLLEPEERVRSKSILKVPGGTLLGQYALATLDGMLVRAVHI